MDVHPIEDAARRWRACSIWYWDWQKKEGKVTLKLDHGWFSKASSVELWIIRFEKQVVEKTNLLHQHMKEKKACKGVDVDFDANSYSKKKKGTRDKDQD
jgi:hypothetical protein